MSALPFGDLIAAGVEKALETSLQGSRAARADLAKLEGKAIRLELIGLPLTLHFLPQGGRMTVAADYHGTADITVRARAASLAAAALKRDGEAIPKGMTISGEAETAQVFSRLLKNADLDWEELLARRIGDVAARQVGNAVRGFLGWGRDAGRRLGQDVADYLHYESRELPPRHEVEGFLAGVDRLRDDAERLTARVKRAESRLRRPT
ncbi:MAG TPA: SCP2 sterol-binding domain-containing protein [Gammaproteobacteria bacterium]|nr:SCP2 sterol-binding domain-containing protein [Gammaproteobacteria bacterium]